MLLRVVDQAANGRLIRDLRCRGFAAGHPAGNRSTVLVEVDSEDDRRLVRRVIAGLSYAATEVV